MKEKMLLGAISAAKDELIGPDEFELRAEGDFTQRRIAQVYREYQRQLKNSNALDFDDLIFQTVSFFPPARTYFCLIRNGSAILW